jgi:hypothetical protein
MLYCGNLPQILICLQSHHSRTPNRGLRGQGNLDHKGMLGSLAIPGTILGRNVPLAANTHGAAGDKMLAS